MLVGALAVVGVAVAGCSNAAAAARRRADTPRPPGGTRSSRACEGQITAETATTWTVTTAKGKAARRWRFRPADGVRHQRVGARHGRAVAPSAPTVRVTGPRNGATVTATRVALGKAKPAPTAPTPAPATT